MQNCLLGPSAKKHTRRVKRFTCQQCGEKFKYRSQLTRHENRSHKQVSDDVATSGTVAAAGEGETEFLFLEIIFNSYVS